MFTPLAVSVSGLAAIAIAGHKRYLKQYLYTKISQSMKTKLTLLLFSLLCALGAWAQSPLTSRSEIDGDKIYTITASDGRGSWMYGTEDPIFVSSTYKLEYTQSSSDTKQQWAFWKKDGSWYLYNVGAERFATAQYGYWWSGSYITLTPFPITPIEEFGASTNSDVKEEYPAIFKFGNGQMYGVSNGQTHAIYRYQSTGDKGNATRIIEVGDFTSALKARADAVGEGALPTASSGSTINYYNIWNMRSDKMVAYTKDGSRLDQTDANTTYCAFYFRAVDDGYYIYSATNGLPLKSVSYNSVTFGTNKDDATKYYIMSSTQSVDLGWGYTLSAKGYCISTASTVGARGAWNDSGQSSVTEYSGSDGGSVWRFASAINTTNNVATLRSEAKDCIDNYTTLGASEAAKNALKTVYDEPFSSVAELEMALESFRNSVSPVFRIKSGHSGYAKDSYIYRDARVNSASSLKWGASTPDILDFSLVKLETTSGLPYTSTSVVAGTYRIVQLYTNDVLFGGDATIADVADSDGQFTITVGGNKKHAQASEQVIVNWNADGYSANGPSTWTFEYVDNASDLAEDIARAETRSIYNHINYTFGTGYGYYTCGNYDPIEVNSYRTILGNSLSAPSTTLSQLNEMLTPDLANNTEMYEYLNDNAAKYGDAAVTFTAPQAGKFFRFKNVDGTKYVKAPAPYYFGESQLEFLSDGTDGASIFYLDASNFMIAYNSGSYLIGVNHTSRIPNYPWKGSFEFLTGSTAGRFYVHAKTEPTGWAGDNKYWGANETTSKIDRVATTTSNSDFIIEDVTSLPITMNKVGGAYYATINLPVAVTIPSGLSAYSATAAGDVLTLTKVVEDGVLAANTPVILYSESSVTSLDIASTAGTAAVSNELEGTTAAISVTANQNYVLNCVDGQVGFYLFNGTAMPGFKAYLPSSATSNVKAFTFSFEDAEDAIRAIESENSGLEIYDISGRRVQKAQKGLYIVNGKKVMYK